MNFIISLNKPVSDKLTEKYSKLEFVVKQNILLDKSFQIFENNEKLYAFSGKIYNKNEFSIETENNAEFISELLDKQYFEQIKKLDGKYTIIIKENDNYTIIRDRHGVNSQVYYNDNYIVSHQKMFLEFNDFTLEPDINNISLFLKIGYIPAPQTALKKVYKLPAGYILSINKNSFKISEQYTFDEFSYDENKINISPDEATEQYMYLHRKTLENRIKNSEKVQILLSGGYDSGGNIDALRNVYAGDVNSFSIGFKGNPWSELPLAKLMSNVYNTNHYEYEIDGSEIEFLPQIVKEFGDPFNESGMMVNFTALRLIKQKGTNDIIIGGDGNDQHFGTAGRELALNYKYRKNGFRIIQNLINSVSDFSIFNKDNVFFKVRFHNSKILNILQSDNFGFRDKEINSLIKQKVDTKNPEYLKKLPDKIETFDDLFITHNYFSDIKQVINEVILFKASRFAQFNNLQMAFPYMSTDIYNFLKTLPVRYKIKGSLDDLAKGKGISKFLHKNYLKDRLPKEITNRKKQGGFAPLPIFFNDDSQYEKISNYIKNSQIAKQIFNENLSKFLDEYKVNKNKKTYWFWYKQVQAFKVFNLLVIAVWWDLTIERKKADTLSELFN